MKSAVVAKQRTHSIPIHPNAPCGQRSHAMTLARSASISIRISALSGERGNGRTTLRTRSFGDNPSRNRRNDSRATLRTKFRSTARRRYRFDVAIPKRGCALPFGRTCREKCAALRILREANTAPKSSGVETRSALRGIPKGTTLPAAMTTPTRTPSGGSDRQAGATLRATGTNHRPPAMATHTD